MAMLAGAAIAGTEALTEGVAGGIVPIITNAMTFLGVNDVLGELAKGAGVVVKKVEDLVHGGSIKEHNVRIDHGQKDSSNIPLENLFEELDIGKVKNMLP